MSHLLDIENLAVQRGEEHVLDGVSLGLDAGEVLAVAGPSGGGKTTLLRVVLGLTAPSGGTIRLRGRRVSDGARILVPPEARKLAVVFQDLALWPHLSVQGNLAFGLAARGVPSAARKAKIATALAAVGLADKGRRYPGQLSGGEQQRVGIARALVLEPDAVLFDEPMSNLDVALKAELLELLSRLLDEGGIAAIYVTHDPGEAAFLADRIAIIEGGTLSQIGTPSELAASPGTAFVRAFVRGSDRGSGFGSVSHSESRH